MATTVTFDGVDATDVTVASTTSLTCTVPAGAAGAVDVVVSTTDDTVTVPGGYTYAQDGPITGIDDTAYYGASTRMTFTAEGMEQTSVYVWLGRGTAEYGPILAASGESPTGGTAEFRLVTDLSTPTNPYDAVFGSSTNDSSEFQRLPGAVNVVTLAPPTVTDSPDTIVQGGTFTITGTGFVDRVMWGVALLNTDLGNRSISRVVRNSDTELVATAGATLTPGVYDAYVIAGGSTSIGSYVNTPMGQVTVTAAVQAVEPVVAPVGSPVEFTATGHNLDQFTDFGVAYDPDPQTPDVEPPTESVAATLVEPVDETTVSFTVELPEPGTYHVVGTGPDGETGAIGVDLIVGETAVADE